MSNHFLRDNFAEMQQHLLRAGVSQPEADMEAARITGQRARNLAYSWADLRYALANHPAILSRLPDGEGTVDYLPLGMASYAVRIDGDVRKQGDWVEAAQGDATTR